MEDKKLMSADVDIAVRFFDALDRLKADGCIGGLKTITDRRSSPNHREVQRRKEAASFL